MATKDKVLVVDDDPAIRGLVQAVLEAEGYEVVTAEDGQQGVALLDRQDDKERFRLVFLDMMMPGLHGLDVLTRMKLHPHTSKLPVIMLTAEKRPEDILSGYSTGADYYMTKPFTRQQLLFGIQLVFDRQKTG